MIQIMKVFKFETKDSVRCGAALAIVAAENGEQAQKFLNDSRGDNKYFSSFIDALDLTNPIEIPCLSTSLTEPKIIETCYYEE